LWSSLEESALKKRYVVRLSGVEREQLEGLVKRGREAAYRRRHAQVLLRADEGERGKVVESISPETVRQVLKKRHQTLAEADVVHPRACECGLRVPDGTFVCQMETVLAVYRRASDPAYPVVRMDETSVQCAREARDPIYRLNLGRANATT